MDRQPYILLSQGPKNTKAATFVVDEYADGAPKVSWHVEFLKGGGITIRWNGFLERMYIEPEVANVINLRFQPRS